MHSVIVDLVANCKFRKTTLLLSVVSFLICSVDLFAQVANTYHVFPQFPDGALQDGTFYRSTLFATNATALDASCRYQLYGMSNDRLSPTNTFVLPANGGVFRASPAGNGAAFAAGYATLTCDRPVLSYIQYEYISAVSGLLGTASLYSAPPGSASEFIFPTGSGYRLAVAIANDSDTPASVTLRLGASGSNELQTTISIGARSRIARFVDELFSIPNGFVPVALLMQSLNAVPFNAIGLIFSGPVFSTVPPLVFQQ
jgi:hypothetical protein